MNSSEEKGVDAPSIEEIKESISQKVGNIIDWISSSAAINFLEFEKELIPRVFALGLLFVSLFLTMREKETRANYPKPANHKWQPEKGRLLGTFFGKVRYWRSYLYRSSGGGGYFPLDVELGLNGDGFSMLVKSYATRIATKMSYAQATVVLSLFLQWSPAQRSIEEMVLGMGRHTGDWFENAPAPENDGEVLIVQIDSKANPTATEAELEKRRGKRKPNPHPGSQPVRLRSGQA